ncbi:putative monovalent cation/H+ antiporter subunit A [Natronospirillum operosum]|uniref:Putative monovalent cation/H+ antiporter subunit A n=1 Tax=Natronospirillum operosum TaxID=2759953 RepID=A0A4Z0WD11_9GAMM|nr:putative monovalent cation/H+ antiporter subunit A [Natronospirillum operosum]TGG93993.1 putative monovalent cation/H+ antiporter subunit A [Natronospirillum operosum]
MLYAVLSGFVVAALVPWLHWLFRSHIGWVLAVLPASLTVYFASMIPAVSGGEIIFQQWAWFPGMDIHLGFTLDGLSLLFALLISFIGTFVMIYAGGYLKGHPALGRFFVVMLSFMASMLGLVLSDNLIALFVFWELTSITSYLLIGFNHDNEDARKCALQGLFVSVIGGFFLLVGMMLLGIYGGTYSIAELLTDSGDWMSAAPVALIIICVLGGTFTKSAQFPFHFWLPNAMAAPTPVSAYLHSATMVKAGVYLMARLNPAFGEEMLWTLALTGFGAVTMFVGAWLSYTHTDAKKVLAYSTVMALGTLTMLIGIGTHYAMIAFSAFLLGHSLYKGALFMIAGAIDHEAGTKDLSRLGGLRKLMPWTAAAALVAALSLAGVPPLFGFIGKELMLEAALSAGPLQALALTLAVVSAMLTAAIAAVIALKPFYGPRLDTPKKPHEAPLSMLAGPVVLAAVSLLFGLVPGLPETMLVTAAVTAVAGVPLDFYLSLWHGFNLPLLLSAVGLSGGALLFFWWDRSREPLRRLMDRLDRFAPETGYFKALDGIVWLCDWQTRLLQNGKMGNYMIVLVMTTVVVVGYTLAAQHGIRFTLDWQDINFYEMAIVALLMVTAVFATTTRSRLGAVATMGVLGFMVALIFILFSAPDLGITQVLVETLTVILLVLVLFRLPGFARYSTLFEIFRDGFVAVSFGLLMTMLVLATLDARMFEPISSYFIEAAYPEALGRNIVNVILVDFRSLDTLGELFVLGIAALGVYSMLKLRAEKLND